MCGFTSSCTRAKSHLRICPPFVHSVVFNNSAQADLGLRCPHMPEHIFAWRGPFAIPMAISYLQQIIITRNVSVFESVLNVPEKNKQLKKSYAREEKK